MPTETPRILELRRRVQSDPSSIAFAQLAEEHRRAGNYHEAIKCCRTGLTRHPGYLSARVTLGRALMETGVLDEAAREFELVLRSAPDNLAAIRGMADIHQRRGAFEPALDDYKRAAARLPEPPRRPAAPPHDAPAPPLPERAPAPQNPPVDFDALLRSLGAPDAAPPPATAMLFNDPVPGVVRPDPVLSDLPLEAVEGDPFAELERELRAFDDARATPKSAPVLAEPPTRPTSTAILDELESWLAALATDRAERGHSSL